MPMAVTRIAITLAVILAAAPASAQLYKWVDANGVTNYSNQPPPDRSAVKGLVKVEDNISVYSPDPGLIKAVEDARHNANQQQPLRARVQALEDQLEAERRARQEQIAAANARAAAYEKCLAAGRTDCNALYGIEPYDPPVVFVPVHPRRPAPHVRQTLPKPGTIAGHVNADSGIIPGTVNSRGGATAGTVTGTHGTIPGNSGAAAARTPSQRTAPPRAVLERR